MSKDGDRNTARKYRGQELHGGSFRYRKHFEEGCKGKKLEAKMGPVERRLQRTSWGQMEPEDTGEPL